MIDLLGALGRRVGVPVASGGEPGGMKVLDGAPWTSDLASAVILAVTVALARFTYRFVEAPCRDWAKDVAGRRHARRAEAIAPAM